MLPVLATVGIVLGLLVMVAATVACLLGLPGSAVVLLVAFLFSACTHWERPPWWMLLVFLGVVAVAETADNLLGAWGTKRFGGSDRGAFWATVGGVAGVLGLGWLGPVLGAPFGPVGWIVGVVLLPLAGGFAGGYLGGYWYELRQGREPAEARRAGWGAFFGRAAGGLLKAILAATMAAITTWMLFRQGGPI
jgi:uncharacterized protein YqgC (DUF456 family)